MHERCLESRTHAPGQGLRVSTSRHQYQVTRLTNHIGPVVPLFLIGLSGLHILSAAAYWFSWFDLTSSNRGAVAAVHVSTALLCAILAGGIHHAFRQEHVDLAGACFVAAITVLCAGSCTAAYVNDMGIILPLPYCALIAVGSASFWLRLRHFVAGLVGAFTPPLILLLVTTPSTFDWFFSIRIALVAFAACTGMYLLVRKANMRLFTLATELERRATYDALTGTLNRAAWVDRAGERLSADRQQGRPTACLFVDMDGFKQVNDTLGHEEGDRVLGDVAAIPLQFSSFDDLVGRIGGDEFVMLLPATNNEQATEMAGRILAVLQSRQPRAGRPVASIGIASSTGSDTLAQLLHRADLAMLGIKERNRQLRIPGDASELQERQAQTAASVA
jgi:diguanylate cyclase (GGDEF)-like protein